MRVLAVILVLSVAAPVLAQIFPRPGRERNAPPVPRVDAPACVSVRAEGWPDGTAYTHVIVVENQCARPVRCELATDADPAPVTIVVAAGRRSETITRRNAPGPGVVASGRCTET